MFDLIRGDHCNNTELEHFPSFYFPQEIYKKENRRTWINKTRLYLPIINYINHGILRRAYIQMTLTSTENNIAEVFGSCHPSWCQPLPYPWLLAATQIMDSGQWQFLIYWLQAKQRVTAVFSNQQQDLWCLPSAALCQRHLASPGFVAPPQRIFLIFPATWGWPPVWNLLWGDG